MTKQEEMMICKEVKEGCLDTLQRNGQNPEKAKEWLDKVTRENFPDAGDKIYSFLHKCIDFLAEKEKTSEHHHTVASK